MRNLYLKILFVACMFVSLLANGQDVEFKKANFKSNPTGFKNALKHLQAGDMYYMNHLYSKALDEYLAANAFNSESAELNGKIGDCYLYSSHKEKSLDFLVKAYKLNKTIDGYYVFLLGRSYHMLEQFENAITYYNKSKTLKSSIDSKLLEKATKAIEECKAGELLIKKPINVEIVNLSEAINTEFQEYVPVINADESEMFFTSRRADGVGGGIDEVIGDYYEDIYYSEKENGEWKTAVNIGEPVNSNRHDATVGLTVDGNTLFLYRDNERGIGNVYMTVRKGQSWTEPEALPEPINSRYKEPSACFDHTGKVIYFVSNRPGGEGGLDIYKATLGEDLKWGNVENLGPTINTPYDEDAVFMHADGKTLYFSSKGHNTMGGFDIFMSTLDKGIWSKPVNIGYPVNSPDDDICFVVTANGETGYYTSNKVDGKGKRDIYRVTFLDIIKENNRPKLTLFKGVVKNKKTGAPINATIEVYDNDEGKLIGTYESNSATGKYMISLPSGHDYGINVMAEGYLFYSENFNLPESKVYEEVQKDIELEKIEVGRKVVLNNIFYDYNDASLRDKSYNELDKVVLLLSKNPKLRLEISAHTDARGGDSYNLELSQRRAQSCVNYLVSKGVDKSRLVAKGYGEKKPIISEEDINDFSTEEQKEEAHQRNRRTEFKILEN